MAQAQAATGTLSFRIVLLGDLAVGKTSIVCRLIKNEWSENHEATIGASYFTYTTEVEQRAVRLEIWDTAGQERYDSITPIYYRSADAALVVYDISQAKSLERARMWVSKLRTETTAEAHNMLICLVGNKSDLEEQRQIPTLQGQQYAEEASLLFCETTAKELPSVRQAFMQLAAALLKRGPRPGLHNTVAVQQQQESGEVQDVGGCC
eukprot:TRINITY_DN14730_c0_g1_i1.p1 TRINITY_DN14730_c0_g1~~TRINITY_DN14730_c0_g1_i1.p1  ORF type:complete len:208 (-),score=34.50 TRINITY_DN14730_c0_g1_i1:150-773(-)